MKSERCAGFALGAVLLAVVLVGAVAAAIAASTGGSVNTSRIQQNRISAGAVIAQANDIKADLSMAESDGYETFRLARTHADCPATAFCLYNDEDGYGMPPQVPTTMAVADAAWQWGSARVQLGGQDLGSSASETVIILPGVQALVCRQINNILNDDPPDVYNNTADNNRNIVSAGALTSSTGVEIASIAVDDTYRAGCFADAGADPDGDNDYTFVDVIKVN